MELEISVIRTAQRDKYDIFVRTPHDRSLLDGYFDVFDFQLFTLVV
jgi:hypothetical protein